MGEFNTEEFPLERRISFHKLLEQYDRMAEGDDEFLAQKAKYVLKAQAPYPVLREGFTDVALIKKHEKVINIILQDTFSTVLGKNEIKTASLPYYNIIFNSTERFEKIIEAAGKDFELKIRGIPDELNYIMGCTVILNYYYGFKLDFKRPMFYDIPDSNGIMKHYRILYNADFMDLIPTDKAKELTQVDVDELLENFDNVEVWKEKIPPGSFISKGFVISNMFDATTEHSISEIKSTLISNDKRAGENFVDNIQGIFKSFFNIQDINVGFVAYNPAEEKFEKVHGKKMVSYLLNEKEKEACCEVFCHRSYSKVLKENDYFAIADVDKINKISKGQEPYASLHKQGIKSAILAPIANDGKLLVNWEFVSKTKFKISKNYFPNKPYKNKVAVQIAASGPDTDWANIMDVIFAAIVSADDYVYITTPYFIPNDEIIMAIQIASRSGIDVRLLIPDSSDSWMALHATDSYLQRLFDANIKVYRYTKGFIHAKTIVLDDVFSTIGTANMDYRSFNINFEINAVIYNSNLSQQLKAIYLEDIENASLMDSEAWRNRSKFKKAKEAYAKLWAPLL